MIYLYIYYYFFINAVDSLWANSWIDYDYIRYSDIKRFHIDEIVEADLWFPWTTQEFVVRLNLLVPGCSIEIYRYSFPRPRRVHSESQEQFLFFFVMVMQCKRSRKSGCFRWWKELLSYVKFQFMKTRNLGNLRRQLSVYLWKLRRRE